MLHDRIGHCKGTSRVARRPFSARRNTQESLIRCLISHCGSVRLPRDELGNGREALGWYSMAGNKGSVDAEIKVGYLYLNGFDNVQRDYEQALKWFRKAAQKGNGEAEFNVGRMYEQGLGVGASVDEAAAWYTKAAQHEFTQAARALRNLGR